MKKKIIITSLVMASVLPFIGKMETARADEAKNLNEKAKSDLDQAKESLKALKDEKAKVDKDLEQAKKDASAKEEEKQADLDKVGKISENIKTNQEILDKDKKIKDLESEIENIDKKMKEAEKEAEDAQTSLSKAESDYKKEKENPSKANDFASADKAKKLKEEYDRAEDSYGQAKTKEKNLNKDLAEKEKEFFEVNGQKKGLEDFFEEYEKDPANAKKIQDQSYKDFKKKSLEEANKLKDKHDKIEGEIGAKKEELAKQSKIIAEREEERNDKYNAYKKEDLGVSYEKDYKNKIISDDQLGKLVEDKTKEVSDAYKELQQCIREKEEARKNFEEYLENERVKQREIEKSKAIANWLNEQVRLGKDEFVKANKVGLKKLAKTHEERKKYIIGELNKFAGQKQSLKRKLDYIIDNQFAQAQATYETKVNSLAALKEFREFLENKKKGLGNPAILKALAEKVEAAKSDLDKKIEKIRDLGKEDEKLKDMRKDLGDLTKEEVQKAKDQIEKDKEEIARLKDRIKELENSKELVEVNNLENKIRELDKKIKDIKNHIFNLEKPRISNEKTYENSKLGNTDEEDATDDVWKGLSEMTLEKIDEQIRQKNIRTELKTHLNKYNKLMVAAQKYVEKFTLSRDKKIDGKSYDKLKMDIRVIKKIIDIIENLIKTGDLSDQERIDFVNIIKELKMNINLVEKSLSQLQ